MLLLAACSADLTSNGNDTDDGTVAGDEVPGEPTAAFVTAMQEEGVTVEAGDHISQPYFKGSGTEIRVNGETVQVFEYQTPDAAEEDADMISLDGTTIGDSQIAWVDEPHFYRSGRLLVLYVGTTAPVLDALEDELGAQIAGGATDDEDFGSDSGTGDGVDQ